MKDVRMLNRLKNEWIKNGLNNYTKKGMLRFSLLMCFVLGFALNSNGQATGNYNAGAFGVDSPTVRPICSGGHDLYVTFGNRGHKVINSIQYKLYLNGTSLASGTKSVKLDTLGGNSPYSTDTSLFLQNVSFTQGANNIEVRVEQVNGKNDTINTNDTLRQTIKTGLSGNYTVGGTSSDFPTLIGALGALSNRGVCGPVDLQIQSGTYNGPITITGIKGLSSTNTLDFIGSGKSFTTITANTSGGGFIGGPADPTLRIINLGHIGFKKMTIENTGEGVSLQGYNVNDIIVKNCKFKNPLSVPGFTKSPGSNLEFSTCSNITLRNNLFSGPGPRVAAVRLIGPGKNIKVAKNNFKNWSLAGLYLSGLSNIKVDTNTFNDTRGGSVGEDAIVAVGAQESKNLKIRNNSISATKRGYTGIEIRDYSEIKVSYNDIVHWGKHGIDLRSSFDIHIDSNMLDGKAKSSSDNGIRINSCQNLFIKGNTIKSSKNIGIILSKSRNAEIHKNKLVNSLGNHGISIIDGKQCLVKNNMIEHNAPKGAGINLDQASNLKIYNNSVHTNAGNFAIVSRSSSNCKVINNNLKGGNIASVGDLEEGDVYFNANNYDNNGPLYTNGNNSFSKLKTWKLNFPGDNQVAWTQPASFKSGNNLHIPSSQSFLRGAPVGVKEDFDGDARCERGPTIGADESNVLPSNNPSLNVSIPDTVYVGKSFTVTNNSPISGQSYTWYLNGKKVSNKYEPTFKTGKDFLQDTVKVVTKNCKPAQASLMDTVDVVAHPKRPNVKFFASKNQLFEESSIKLNDASQNAITERKWWIRPRNQFTPGNIKVYHSFLGSTDSTSKIPRVIFYDTGSYDVCLAAYNLNSKGKKRGDTLCKKNYLEVKKSYEICRSGQSVVRSPQGQLFDPGGINDYSETSRERTCSFLINPCADSVILTMDSFSTDFGVTVRIYDGVNDNGTMLASLDGPSPSMGDSIFIANSGAAYITWGQESYHESDDGFGLRWQAYGGSFNKPNAGISGPDSVCFGTSYVFQKQRDNLNSGELSTNIWYLNGFTENDKIATGNKFNYSPQNIGYDTIHLVVSECGFKDTATKKVYVRNTQNIDVSFEPNMTRPDVGDEIVRFSNNSFPCLTNSNWSISPSSFSYKNGTGKNSVNPEVIFKDTVAYEVKLNASNSGASGTYVDTIRPVNRCKPSVQNTLSDIGITNFELNKIKNSTGVNSSGYVSYTNSHSTKLQKGISYELIVERKTTFNEMTRKIWIDYNIDGDFNDKGELLAREANAQTKSWKVNFKVPAFAKTGVTAIRVGAFADSNRGPCSQISYGEIEDYRIDIKNDITAPKITLDGQDTLKMEICDNFSSKDTGAIAVDNLEGNITSRLNITSNVDTTRPGFYTINYKVTDQAGNRAEKTRYVEVFADTTDPMISLNGKSQIELAVNTSYQDPGYFASDGCAGLMNRDTLNTVNSAKVGNYSVRYMVVDSAGNKASVVRSVLVKDTTKPTITFAEDTLKVNVDSSYNYPSPDFNDNYWPESTLQIERSGKVNTEVIGTYHVTYTATDSSDNTRSRIRVVIVRDTINPSIAFNKADTITLDVYDKLEPRQIIYNVGDNYYSFNDLNLITEGSYYETFGVQDADSLGWFTATLGYSDPSGNKETFQMVVRVLDREAPNIELIGPSYTKVKRWEETPYVDSYEVSDNYYPTDSIRVDLNGSYFSNYIQNDYPAGTYEISYQARDKSGNKSEKAFRYVETMENTGNAEVNKERQQVRIYPNPTNGRFKLKVNLTEGKSLKIDILNSQGKHIKSIEEERVQNENYSIDLREFAAGIYQIRIQTGEQMISKELMLRN